MRNRSTLEEEEEEKKRRRTRRRLTSGALALQAGGGGGGGKPDEVAALCLHSGDEVSVRVTASRGQRWRLWVVALWVKGV